jgi:DNA-binding transcriptional ArsR family regulator
MDMEIKKMLNRELLEKQARILRAISHPVRIALLDLLQEKKELSVTEIHNTLNLRQAEASHHLGILRDKGILNSIRDGKSIKYSLKIEKLSQIINCINSCNLD